MVQYLFKLFSYLFCLLFFGGCVVNRNNNEAYLQKSLDHSTWVLTRVKDQSKTDTIYFSFGYSETNEEMNLLDIHSGSRKELTQFSLSKRKIRFFIGNGFYCFNNTTTKSKKMQYVLVFKESSLRFKRPSGINKEIKFRRL